MGLDETLRADWQFRRFVEIPHDAKDRGVLDGMPNVNDGKEEIQRAVA